MNPIGNESETTIPATTGHILLVFLHRAVKGHKPPWAAPTTCLGMDVDREDVGKKNPMGKEENLGSTITSEAKTNKQPTIS